MISDIFFSLAVTRILSLIKNEYVEKMLKKKEITRSEDMERAKSYKTLEVHAVQLLDHSIVKIDHN